MAEVVSFGETMVLMDPVENGPLKYVNEFRKKIGGAESNFAVGMSRLGHDSGWFSKLGKDPHGEYVESVVAGEGVNTSEVAFTDQAPTGIMFKERISNRETHVYYYRHRSAASKMEASDIPETYITEAEHMHVTGITPVLSDSCREAVEKAFDIAEENNTRTSFDPNIRMKLWEGEETRQTLLRFIESADIVIMSQEEAEKLLDIQDQENILEEILSRGAEKVAVTLGDEGAIASDGDNVKMDRGYNFNIVDTVGAGDAFDAGFISGFLDGKNLEEALDRANLCGGLATTFSGDMEGLPTRKDLKKEKSGEKITR